MNLKNSLLALALSLLPVVASAQTSTSVGTAGAGGFASFVQTIVGIINLLVESLAGVALVLFFAGGVRYLYKAGGKNTEERKAMSWSLLALFILFSVWGILNLMNQALFGTGTSSSVGSSGTDTIVTGSTPAPLNLPSSSQYQSFPQNPPLPPARPAGL
jgi:hypothetical protein